MHQPNHNPWLHSGGHAHLPNPNGDPIWTFSGTGQGLAVDEPHYGYFCFYGQGTWAAAEARLFASLDGEEWFEVPGTSLSGSDSYKVVQLFTRYLAVQVQNATGASLSFYVGDVVIRALP